MELRNRLKLSNGGAPASEMTTGQPKFLMSASKRKADVVRFKFRNLRLNVRFYVVKIAKMTVCFRPGADAERAQLVATSIRC